MIRTQIQLPEEQLKWLRQQAAIEGVSMSEIVRRALRAQQEKVVSRAELLQRVEDIIGKYHDPDPFVAQQHDEYLTEAYEQ